MATQKFSVSKLINSPPQIIYSIIADYNIGHPGILPKPPFVSLEVKKGGVGAGTEMIVKLKMFGKVQSYHAVVTEPEPGKTLVETTDTGYITTFSVESRKNGNSCLVTFSTEIANYSGIMKKFEFWVTSKLLQPVYKKELENLAEASAKKMNPA
jgi:Polyketide cyclase / dehydrase and lipid transport